jgi:microcystin-dependent protein
MATNFPTSLDALTNPTLGQALNSPSHSGQHTNSNDAIEALQAKVGVNSSAVTTSLDYKMRINNPVGEITLWATSTAPTGWLIADGSAISRSTYSDLFAVLSTTYGVGDGSTTFNLPNLKGKVPVGRDSSQVEFDTVGETGGSKTSALTSTNLPAHTHTVDSNTLDVLYNAGSYTTGYITGRDANNDGVIDGTSNTFGIAVGSATDHTHTIATSGGNGTATGNTFSNLAPYIVLNYIIRF